MEPPAQILSYLQKKCKKKFLFNKNILILLFYFIKIYILLYFILAKRGGQLLADHFDSCICFYRTGSDPSGEQDCNLSITVCSEIPDRAERTGMARGGQLYFKKRKQSKIRCNNILN